jgi:hypothetical protein
MIASFISVTKTKFTTPAFYLCILLLLFSCATAPVQEMSDARQAIQAAKEAGMQSPQPPDLLKAETLLNEAEVALQNGDYESARAKAKQARKAALQAQKALNNSHFSDQ